MKLFNYIKAGAKIAPAFIIIVYYIFVSLDLYTTFIASPDLRYEGNWFIRYFNLNWSQIIIKDSLIVILITLGLLIAMNYINIYYQKKLKYDHFFIVEVLYKRKLLISFIILCCFYAHLFYSVFVTFSNYLSYIYLHKTNNLLSNISTYYIDRVIMNYSYIFTWYQMFFITAAFIFTTFKVKSIRNKYRTISI